MHVNLNAIGPSLILIERKTEDKKYNNKVSRYDVYQVTSLAKNSKMIKGLTYKWLNESYNNKFIVYRYINNETIN